jgi:regulator of sirC expression with transglutaminase-like and TPR domain
MQSIRAFENELRSEHPLPERLALAIAGVAYPELDWARCESQLDAVARVVTEHLSDVDEGRPRAEALVRVLHDELGYAGDTNDYYDPRNSYLNEVLDRRLGLPILLSVLYMAVAERVGYSVCGIGFPGHFMVRYADGHGSWLLDPYHGRVVDPNDAAEYLSGLFGKHVTLRAEDALPVTPDALAQRILANLRHIYWRRDDHARTVRVLDYWLALRPNDAEAWRERGLLRYRIDDIEGCARDLRRYFFLRGRVQVLLPGRDGESPVPTGLNPQDRQVYTILQQVEQYRGRLN